MKSLDIGEHILTDDQAGVGIGLVFASLLTAVARNPSMRGQLFSYAILGFAFVEAIGVCITRISPAIILLRLSARSEDSVLARFRRLKY